MTPLDQNGREIKLPKEFTLFCTKIKVVFDNTYCNDHKRYGEYDYSKNQITLSDMDGVHKLSDDRILDAFYHEKIHAILEAMHERDLSNNEKFVDVFAKLLRQSDETANPQPI